MQIKAWLSLGAAALLVSSLSGCGKLVSGANAVPTVEYRADVTAAAASTDVATTDPSATTEAGGVGTLKGKVVFEGSFSELSPIFAKGAATKDPTVCGAEVIPDESVIVKDGGLANVFIYLEKAPKGAKSEPAAESIKFDQRTCIFLPHALLVRTKQTVFVLNDDDAAHNTHTNPQKNSAFNKVVSPKDRTGVPLKYELAEKQPLSVVCDIHSWMKAYHLPLDHSFADISKGDGSFEIKDLPVGKHEFKVWHEAGQFLEKSRAVTIKPGDNEITIKVPASKLGK